MYMLFQCCTGDIAVSYIPEPFLRIPCSADGFNLFAKFSFITCNLHGNNGVSRKFIRWWFPISTLNYQFSRFYALPCRGIVPEPDTNKVITVFAGQAFCATLAWFKDEASFHALSHLENLLSKYTQTLIMCNL
jgi:hypothetical protein